jgi:thymidylate synthase (FAD)
MKVELIDHMGTDLSIVNAARVSLNKKSEFLPDGTLSEADTKLITYLAKHKHMSPFGHCFATFRVEAPIFVIRQLVKHEYLRVNEVSRRYHDGEPEFHNPENWRSRAPSVKQGSLDDEFVTEIPDPIDTANGDVECFIPISQGYDELVKAAKITYNNMLKAGVAPEMARMVLPQSMMTMWWWSGSMDAFARMVKLRLDPHAQVESRVVAQMVDAEMRKLYPVGWDAMMKYMEV